MATEHLLLILITMTPITLPGQQARDIDLAHQLASETTQKAAADALAASGQEKVPLLLEWIKTPPFPLDDVQLTTFDAGLADAFGALKVKEAIPFLTRNITIRRSPFTLPPWKTAETVMERLPAVAALIRIGADALKALIDAPYSPMDMDQRLARIFVVSRIAATVSDKTQAIQYLRHAQAEARLQNYWADEALQFVGDR